MQRNEWLLQLSSYKGVPFLHQGRSRAGIDCVGLLACAADDLGYPNYIKADLRDYQRTPNADMFTEHISRVLTKLPYNRLQPLSQQCQPGDVLAFWVDKRGLPRHVAVYMGHNIEGVETILHSVATNPKRVCEQNLSTYWRTRIDSLWTLPMFKD